ncbi:MAG: helix-turn-helix transcriptional regulator [Lachnospiraceae bacterium]
MMKYDGYNVGPIARQLRVDRNLTIDQVSEITGLSYSSIQQIEQGGRNLSMNSLYLFMNAYECDANTMLNIHRESSADIKDNSIDELLDDLPDNEKIFLKQSFMYMIQQAKKLAS